MSKTQAVLTPANYLRRYLITTVSALLCIVMINAIVDPLWVYHAPWLPQRFVKDQRQANPGIARFSTYDSVVIGNSLTENFLVSEIESRLHWKPLKLCIKGSTPREQRLILDQAVATRQVHDVLWAIDYFSFQQGPDATAVADFPFHLYARDAATPGKYLLSLSTLLESVKVLTGGGAKTLESRYVWYQKKKFGLEWMLAQWQSTVSQPENFPVNEEQAYRSAQTHLISAIQSNPEIRFHLLFLPYSALYRVTELINPNGQFAIRMNFKRALAKELLSYPNVEVFDFETADEITHDVEKYADLTHFDLATSTAILGWIAEGKYRMTTKSVDDRIEQLEQDTIDYASSVFAPENPFRDQMQINTLKLKLPESVVERVNRKKTSVIRTVSDEVEATR